MNRNSSTYSIASDQSTRKAGCIHVRAARNNYHKHRCPIPHARREYQPQTRATRGKEKGELTVGPVQGAGDGGELAADVDVLEHGLLQPREVAVALLEH
jgi:hypothetical protein